MSSASLLTERMLDELKARWREQEAPILQALRPGLDPSEMQAATEPLGIRLPAEVRVWWGWHDGAKPSLTSHAIGLDWLYLTLEDALARCGEERAGAADAVEEGVSPPQTWQPGWLPLATRGDGAVMVCDCSVPEAASTPVHRVHWEKFGEGSLVPVAPSLGTVVLWWIGALDRGAWVYDRKRRRWEEHPERLADPSLSRTGLV
jgi:cell wall assembly regulator SMI1